MSKQDRLTKATVLTTLNDKAIKKINFLIGAYKISNSLFEDVIKEIKKDNITVKFDASIQGLAYYNPITNEIELGYTSAADLARQALIVHECTHAACDVQNYTLMSNLVSEAAGYVAQCMYLLVKMPNTRQRLTSPDAQSDGIFKIAWKIAKAELNDRRITNADYSALENAIKGHLLYKSQVSDPTGYDGV